MRLFRGRYRLLLALTLLAATVVTACSGNAGANTDTLVVGLYTEPTAIDPQREYYWETFRVARNVYEPLVQEELSSSTGVTKLVPGLATAWHSNPDGSVWTFDLRRNVKFHDGTDFDAAALDFNVKRFSDPSFEFYDQKSAAMLKARFSDLRSTRVVDDHTYEFSFNHPYLGFPRLLAQSIGSPLVFSPTALQKYGNDGLSDHPTGTGPYTWVERKVNDHITLARFDGYWGEQPQLNRLVFRTIANNQSRLAAFQSGEIDILTRVQPTDVKLLEGQGASVPTGTGAQLDYASFLFGNRWAQNPQVRSAVALAIDRDGIARNIYSGYAQPLWSFLNPGNEAYDADHRVYRYDPEQAKQILAAAGITPGQVSFNIIADLAGQPEAEYISGNLKSVGIDAPVIALERGNYSARISKPQPDDGFHLGEYGGTYPEWVQEGFNSTVLANGGEQYVDHPAIKESFDAARYTSDPAARIGLWQHADEVVAGSHAVIPTVNFTRYYAVSPDVHGFVWPNTNWYDLGPVTKAAG
ncbi:ABC transporter substrate-binding protein [Gordonia sp. NB41Y]|uniref:ABC transporter substrate-binding protein n=1 Tax=Gordonia sp. NB41Y TaxID=875808 RepID=UPI0006B20893|nr:ABC transporter substrate-binding protein [Gordonia sp. NB41Y]EMP14315.2 peptide ABC transporter substrate-binding protein [Gordonia sp. NB41Y]WLP91646.1 ABC transporter substrate-binding protein [Gordonia sp. NB41Y]